MSDAIENWGTAIAELDALFEANGRFLDGLIKIAKENPDLFDRPDRSFLEEILGDEIPHITKLEKDSIKLTTEDKKSFAENTEINHFLGEREPAIEDFKDIDKTRLFQDVLRQPETAAEVAFMEAVQHYLEPHEIEDAIRGKKSVGQVTELIEKSIVKRNFEMMREEHKDLMEGIKMAREEAIEPENPISKEHGVLQDIQKGVEVTPDATPAVEDKGGPEIER